jgi:hypothetical protein
MKKALTLAVAECLASWQHPRTADIIGFEAVTAGGTLNVGPSTLYSEDGYTFTPSNGNSAIFGLSTGVTLFSK